MWPDTFGLACCAIEMMSIVSSRYDIARFGMEAFRSSPRQADLLIVSGRVAHKMAAPLRQIYDQMLEPKWVIAMGACASSGGMFNNYTIAPGRRQDRPGRHPRARLPAAARGADGGHRPAAREGHGRRAARLRDPRRSPSRELRRRSRARRDARGARRDDARRRPAAPRRGVRRTSATSSASTSSPTSRATDYLGWGASGVAGYIGTRGGRDLNAPGDAGARPRCRGPKPKRFSVNYHLLALARRTRRACACRPGSTTARASRASSRSGRPPTGTSARPGT